jgi:ribonuclease BN (tRNA processing enzyme)
VKLTVIGCSPAWPNPGSAQSGYLVEGEGRLLVDCGPGVLSRLREQESWPRVDAIAVTHLHLDHVADLVGWVYGRLLGPARDEPSVPLWLPRGGTADLLQLVGRAGEAFELREYDDGQTFEAAGFTITARAVPHPAHAHGFRVTDGRSTLAHSGDSGPSPVLAELARGADLFLCEATNADPGDGPTHLTSAQAREVAAAAGAHRLVLVHRPAELPPDGCEVAYDGLELEL